MGRVLIAAALTLMLGGCTVGPAYHRPAAPVPPAFKEPPPEGWKQAQPNDAIPRGPWWEIYQDPQLNALEAQVSISNQNVLAAMAQYREARDQVRIARASLFPVVTAAPSVTATKAPGAFVIGNAVTAASGSIVDYALPVDVSYQADVWGSIRRSVGAARATAQASAADLENARLAYQAQLAGMYFALHGLDADAGLLQKTVTLYEQSLALTRGQFTAGVVSGADVALAETQLQTTRAQLIDVGVSRAQFEHAIAILTGQPPSQVSIPAAVITTPPPEVPVGLPSALLERRPDITAMERAVASANEQIGIARSAFFPSLTLSASGGFESTSLAQWLTWPSRFWTAGPQLAATLFDGGKRKAQVALAEDAYDAAAANYRQTVLAAFQQVEDQVSSLRILEQEGRAQDVAVAAARRSLDIVTAQYSAGTATYLQVIVAQTTALQNQRAAIDILTRRLTASVLLVEALGGGWDASQLATP
jgi:NodT family efflux transporter outer membrane factor (OMF) lipoprotein